jgi:alkylated DNA repair dioxygenase AlkB
LVLLQLKVASTLIDFIGSLQINLKKKSKIDNLKSEFNMDLFNDTIETNLLPKDGTVIYYGKVFSEKESRDFTKKLFENIEWKNDEATIFGKHIITKRKVAWYADKDFSYTYSGSTKYALPWTEELLTIKKIAEKKTGFIFNSCLLNLYHDGNEGMAWHSDDEKELVKDSCIASLSFGAERKFMLKHKSTKETISILLESGSLLSMQDETQTYWLHQLPKTTKVKTPRVNLTFRMMHG